MGLNINPFLIFLSCALSSSSLPLENGKCSPKCLIPIDVDVKCGSDGISYQNIEELRCARERCFPDLKLAYDGKCRNTFQLGTTRPDSTSTHSPDLYRPHSKSRPKSEYPKIHFASKDPETYEHGVHHQVNSLVPTSNTRLIKSGPGKQDLKCNADDCVCDLVLAPVCGSDGVTYGNDCILDCIRKCDPVVAFHHGGFCGKIFFPLDQIPFFRVLKMTA